MYHLASILHAGAVKRTPPEDKTHNLCAITHNNEGFARKSTPDKRRSFYDKIADNSHPSSEHSIANYKPENS